MPITELNYSTKSLIQKLDEALPQTQCTKCGFPDCAAYAQAMGSGQANINRCPPGGREGIERLAILLNTNPIPLDITHGEERSRPLAVIDEKLCIGCTLCIKACPVDAIVGAPKQLHLVINDRCTGCDLCVSPCPVDCIRMVPQTNTKTGWDAWSTAQAQQAKIHYEARKIRLIREEKDLQQRLVNKAAAKLLAVERDQEDSQKALAEKERKKAIIAAAMAKAKLKLDGSSS